MTVPIGMGVIRTKETKIAAEVCEELWVPDSPHIAYALEGVEIFANGSGSHHQLRKLDARMNLMSSATTKCGGCYMYANQRGCDGTRLYFDGSSMINVNGEMLVQASQFSLQDVEVVTTCIDLNDIRRYRAGLLYAGTSYTEDGQRFIFIIMPCHVSCYRCHYSLLYTVLMTFSPSKQGFTHAEQECALGPRLLVVGLFKKKRG